MKHTIEELHFAAKVRDLAVNLRQSEFADALHEWQKNLTSDEISAGIGEFRSDWFASKPVNGYMAEAYQLIQHAADIISDIRNSLS